MLQVLKNYGNKGRSVGKIVEEMSKKGLREFSSARNAKSSVASTCAHDAAFARVAPGTFALRAVPGVVEVILSLCLGLCNGDGSGRDKNHFLPILFSFSSV